MLDSNINEKAINDAHKNALLAMQSITDILPKIKDGELKKELRAEFSGYEKISKKIADYMKKNKINKSKVSSFQKAMMKGSINLKTMINDSRNHIADMLLKGTTMGINELTAMKNEKQNLNEEVAALIEELLTLEESYAENLKTFL